jgi:outer membrane protein OmpA-like peptidoglycan-associated protein
MTPAKRFFVTAVTSQMQGRRYGGAIKIGCHPQPRTEAPMPKNCMPKNLASLLTSGATAPAQPKSSGAKSSAAVKYAYLLVCGLSLALGAAPASAEELSHDEMVCALDPQCAMPIVDRRLRGITATTSVRTPGSFDRTVNFAFNSAELTADARRDLDKVAAVLTDSNVEKYPIVIHGHTDGVGTAEYNQRLSERRAEAARQYFITQHGIDPSRLVARGHGKSQLLTPDPTSEANRRVQFQNASYATASVPAVASRPVPTSPAPAPQRVQAVAAPTADGEGL